MNRSILSAVVVLLALSAAAFAKEKDQVCSISDPVTVEHRDKVTVRTISFLDTAPIRDGEKREVVNAHVYVPDGDGPFPMILFSHSAIHSNKGTSDLLPYAFAMARGGAASIVLERTIQWEPYDEDANKDRSVMDCASHWLATNIKFNGHLSTLGTYGGYWHGLYTAEYCKSMPHDGCHVAVGLGWMKPAEQLNTEYLLSEEHYARAAQWMARHLQLTIDPSWFKLALKQDTAEIAAK